MDLAQRREICDRFGRTVRDVLVLGDLDPQAIDTRTIRDPVNQPRAVFEESYARIERCVRALERAIGPLGAAAPRPLSAHPRAADDLRDGA
jgi:protein-tyrosine-phosphatase